MGKRNETYLNSLVGEKRNRLTVIDAIPNENRFKSRLKVRCECGKGFLLIPNSFVSGRTTSCGCRKKELHNGKFTIHALNKHPLYTIWKNIKGRCYTKTNKAYYNYGALGITVCPEWLTDFKSFYD